MLNPERITIGKLKQAYTLNEQDIQELLSATPSDGIFPDTLWRTAYKSFWFDPMESYLSAYRLGTLFNSSSLDFLLFPEITLPYDDYFYIQKWKEQILVLFDSLSGILASDKLEKGINYIFEKTYDGSDDIFQEERKKLFCKIAEEDKYYILKFTTCENINSLLDIMFWKRRAVSHADHTFLSTVFMDSIIINKPVAIRRLFKCGYPLRREVKGVSQAVVEQITALPATQSQAATDGQFVEVPAAPSASTIMVPRALWEGKSPKAVHDGMKDDYAAPVIAYILFKQCGITKKRIGQLLSGKTFTDEKSYRNIANDLLEKASALTITSV